MEESQIKQIIEQQPLHGSALLDPRCKILLLVCIGFVSYFLAGEVVSLALMLVYGLFIAVGNGGKWALKMIVVYIIVAYLNALLRYVQVPVLSVIMSVFGVTLLKLELLEAAPASSSSTGTAATQSVTGEVVSAATSSLSLMAEGDMVYDFDFSDTGWPTANVPGGVTVGARVTVYYTGTLGERDCVVTLIDAA